MELNILIFKSFLYALPGQSAFYLNALKLRAQPAAMAATAALRAAISAPLTRCNKPSCRLSRAQACQRASIAPEVAPVPAKASFLSSLLPERRSILQYLPFNTRLTGTLDGYNDPFNPKIFQFAGFSIIIGQGTQR